MKSFSLTTEMQSEGIACMWPNGELAGFIRHKAFPGGPSLWHVEPAETGMPHWSFHSRQAAEFYMLAAAYEYIDNTEDDNKLKKAA